MKILKHYPLSHGNWLCKEYDESMIERDEDGHIQLTDEMLMASCHFQMTFVMAVHVFKRSMDPKGPCHQYSDLCDKLEKWFNQDPDSTSELGLTQACCEDYNGWYPAFRLLVSPSELWSDESFQENWASEFCHWTDVRLHEGLVWRFTAHE